MKSVNDTFWRNLQQNLGETRPKDKKDAVQSSATSDESEYAPDKTSNSTPKIKMPENVQGDLHLSLWTRRARYW
jgi:hypothetical protein